MRGDKGDKGNDGPRGNIGLTGAAGPIGGDGVRLIEFSMLTKFSHIQFLACGSSRSTGKHCK
jgi:hypothetical protein